MFSLMTTVSTKHSLLAWKVDKYISIYGRLSCKPLEFPVKSATNITRVLTDALSRGGEGQMTCGVNVSGVLYSPFPEKKNNNS